MVSARFVCLIAMHYAELHCISNFSFLRGASHPRELVETAATLGYRALAITDECSLSGIVQAHVAAQELGIELIIGSELFLEEGDHVVVLVTNRQAYSELSALITLARRRCEKGQYRCFRRDLQANLKHCLIIWKADKECPPEDMDSWLEWARAFEDRFYLGFSQYRDGSDAARYAVALRLQAIGEWAIVACSDVHMHCPQRKRLQDVLSAIRLNKTLQQLGTALQSNAERCLKPRDQLQALYPKPLLQASLALAERCHFSLESLRYNYPQEVVPSSLSAGDYLRWLVECGAAKRWPEGVPENIQQQIEHELELIREMQYEYYFLTVYDIVDFARSRNILCQGRGSAANSVVCYCLMITAVPPDKISLLFERFISKERNEPPDIDVDFEHERREEVIQYIYKKYGRERAALAATLITYRPRSAIRDVGKALGLDELFIQELSRSLAWWDRRADLEKRFRQRGLQQGAHLSQQFLELIHEIQGFPRHLSQHVGGFVITQEPISTLVPVENASMAERTVIQWDKQAIEDMALLKIDVLGLGMLSCLRKSLQLVTDHYRQDYELASIPADDPATYAMLQRGESTGVFQVESRAQMSMLPRLKPQTFYDLVVQVAIVRPGPIQGDMVHPYLRRRQGIEAVSYPSAEVKAVLERTLGVPIFQEQVIKLAMVAAGFSGGEADRLRRAMASWGKNGDLQSFRQQLLDGMRQRGHSADFAERLFEQMKGFGAYGFPESHAASFALLVYSSAWLKCHYPAAFYCALLNSQPMGFYSPSQLIQDARRQGIPVLPIDVQSSQWDHQLETLPAQDGQFALRLGMRLIKGFERSSAELICEQNHSPFSDLQDFQQRCGLRQDQRQKLAAAGAFSCFGEHRYQSQWQSLALDHKGPLFENSVAEDLNDGIHLSEARPMDSLNLDYRHTGLTLGPHPMSLLRAEIAELKSCLRSSDLSQLGHRRFARVAGLVTGRQRPGTASGVVFLTLEDETGNSNIVVWKSVQERCREALLRGKLLIVKGVVETEQKVTHLIAGELIDCSHYLQDTRLTSRDFH